MRGNVGGCDSRETIKAIKDDADNTVTTMVLRMNREVIRSLVHYTIDRP